MYVHCCHSRLIRRHFTVCLKGLKYWEWSNKKVKKINKRRERENIAPEANSRRALFNIKLSFLFYLSLPIYLPPPPSLSPSSLSLSSPSLPPFWMEAGLWPANRSFTSCGSGRSLLLKRRDGRRAKSNFVCFHFVAQIFTNYYCFCILYLKLIHIKRAVLFYIFAIDLNKA